MLIRTRLLLLALIPLPVLLVLGWAALANARSQWRAAEQLALGLALVEATHQATDAARQRRDAEATTLIRESRGLEALLLGEAGQVSPEFEAPQAPLPALPREVPATLAAGARAVAAYLNELSQRTAAPTDATLGGICASYDPLMRQAAALPELLAADAQSVQHARDLRTLAILERYEDALAKERLYVRYAVETNTFPPEMQRELAANQGLGALERGLLDEVFADDTVREALADASARARESGRDDLLLQLRDFADRQDKLALLNDALGYGGLIHRFKNFVLRGEARDRAEFEAAAVASEGIVNELLAGSSLSDAERVDTRTIAGAIADYRRRLERAAELRARGVAVTRIDQEVRLQTDVAQPALDRLASFRARMAPAQWRAVSAQLLDDVRAVTGALQQRVGANLQRERDARRREFLLLSAAVAATVLLLGAFAAVLYRRLADGIRALVREFERVAASGDVQTRAVVHGEDELAQLNRAVAAIGRRLQAIADAADRMASGDLASTIEPLGDKDRLAHAMGQLAASARAVVAQAQAISAGDYATRVEPRSPEDTLAFALAEMGAALRKFRDDSQQARWLSESQLRVLNAMSSSDTVEALGQGALAVLSELTGAPLGVIHLAGETGLAVVSRVGVANVDVTERSGAGETLVGRALAARRTEIHAPLPAGYLRLKSGLGRADIAALSLTPLRARRESVGVLELGWLAAPDPRAGALLDAVAESLGLALVAADARARTAALLEETRRQAERLREQQEELRQSNEELEEQAQLLRQSEEQLKSQREELQATNEELLEKTNLLQRQREQLETTARDLAQATRYKSEFLANMSHELRTPLNSLLILSKSLVANDEGNLTPEQVESARVIHDGGRDLLQLINDILDLSKVEAGRLDVHAQPLVLGQLVESLRRQFEPVATEKKVDLVFDLQPDAPAEIVSDRQRVEQILRNLLSNALKFTDKGAVTLRIGHAKQRAAAGEPSQPFVAFTVEDTGVGIPEDKLELIFQAFQQGDGSTSRRYGGTGLGLTIARQLATLLGGAVRASSTVGRGSRFTLVLPERMLVRQKRQELPAAGEPSQPFVAFTVEDTGVGIPEGKLELIFQAFQQGDGSTSRRYGGTGLGLTIARQLATLLGGAVRASSTVGRGSRFTLVLPEHMPERPKTQELPAVGPTAGRPPPRDAAAADDAPPPVDPAPVEDDRDQLAEGERSMLVVEDDERFAAIVRDVVRKRGYKCVVATDGASGLRLARRLLPSAILLDLKLPDMDGQRVLDILKWSNATRHIPVHVVSAMEPSNEPLKQGAIGFLHKPAQLSDLQQVVDRLEATLASGARRVLVIEDDPGSQAAIRQLLENPHTTVVQATTAEAAMAHLRESKVDCIVLDLSLPDTDGIEFLEALRRDSEEHPPVVVYTGRELAPEEHRRLAELAQSIVIKGAASPDRLVDDVLLFLHAVEAELPEAQKQAVARLHSGTDAFQGRKILIVDDDLRNVFALSGLLRKRGLEVLVADNGQMAIERLNENPGVDAVLMDIMMPVMDGFEAMRRIRADERFRDLPIIAVTAKAMAEDRRRCMDAGASDYLAKPIELDALVAMLRVWLGRSK